MARAVLALVARFANTNGLTSDAVENVIHNEVDSATYATDLAGAMQQFRDFYIVDSGVDMNAALGTYMSPSLSRAANAAQILAYLSTDLSGATPFGAPVGSLTFTLPGPTNSVPLPDEVALVMSSHADLSGVAVSEANPTPPPATIRPQQRRRGRLYFGPLNTVAIISESGRPRPTSNIRADLCQASANMFVGMTALTDQVWSVWSRADADLYPIIGGFVDNAFDTQRRRGVDPSFRNTWGT